MACDICGYLYCYSSHSCPQCARKHTPVDPKAKEHVEAGHKFGEAVINFLMAFFLNPYLCLVVFAGSGYAVLVMLAPILGITPSSDYLQDKPPWEVLPLWYTVISIVLPTSITVLLRKYIRLIMKWALYILIGGLVLAFVGGVISAIIEKSSS